MYLRFYFLQNGVVPSPGDGLVEIVGLRSTTHLAMTTAKVTRGIRIAQAAEVRINVNERAYVQIDGEIGCE
jgi:hypothetical protein